MAKHIRFLESGEALCDNPDRLGKDFVVADFTDDEVHCHDCSALLMKHNKDAYEDELLYGHNKGLYKEDPLSPARGVIYGLLISSVFWIVLFAILWAVLWA